MTQKPKYYVVWKGRQTGIFSTWAECQAQVQGYSGAEYKAFNSRAEAEAAFRGSYEDYKGKNLDISPLSEEELRRIGRPTADSYAVDAACDGSPGTLEYRGVQTGTRVELFREGPFADGLNNVGEFLAIVQALRLLQQQGLAWPVYSDSEVALGWVEAGRCRTSLQRTGRNDILFERIAQAEAWLATHPYPNPLLKWQTRAWGENPADFGRKR
jgi:ribonuclease HI